MAVRPVSPKGMAALCAKLEQPGAASHSTEQSSTVATCSTVCKVSASPIVYPGIGPWKSWPKQSNTVDVDVDVLVEVLELVVVVDVPRTTRLNVTRVPTG